MGNKRVFVKINSFNSKGERYHGYRMRTKREIATANFDIVLDIRKRIYAQIAALMRRDGVYPEDFLFWSFIEDSQGGDLAVIHIKAIRRL